MIIGNGTPKTFYGFTNYICYKKLDLSVFVYGASGFEIKNSNKLNLSYSNRNYKRSILTVDQRDINYVRELSISDYIMDKGNYLKIDYISLGYTIPLENPFIKFLKIYFVCNNVTRFSAFKDGDPETAGITGVNPGNYWLAVIPIHGSIYWDLKPLYNQCLHPWLIRVSQVVYGIKEP